MRQRYRCIIEMLIQSAALYSVVALAYALAIFVSQRVTQNPELMTTLNVTTTYLGTFYGAIAVGILLAFSCIDLTGRTGHFSDYHGRQSRPKPWQGQGFYDYDRLRSSQI